MKICKVVDCNRIHYGKGYCNRHYKRFKKYRDPLYLIHGREIELHKKQGTVEYATWVQMKQRCYNPKNKHYKDYGGRGIIVCEEWKNSFLAFYKDMGDKPFHKAQIDRKENDKGYYKGNCRWVTNTVNARNKTNIKLSMEKARAIRQKYWIGNIPTIVLSREYNVGTKSIYDVVHNNIWKEVTWV